MTHWREEYNKLKIALENTGWQCVKDEENELEEWYSQGILYANFTKKDKAIHIEFGDEDCIFGEVVEDKN